MEHHDLLSGLIRLHVLHHAAEQEIYGQWMIDELAHRNAPGSRHERRYQDIEDLLDAGIDVYTTVNIQHIESLNDVVQQITGVRVRETVPDAFMDRARDVVLIDLPPRELIERLQQGTTAAVAAMQRSQMQAEGSVDNALQAAEALSGINLQVEAISGMSLQIATAVEEQSAVGEDIQRNLDGIREAGQSTVAASGRSRHSAEHVASLVERLQLLAEQFRGNAQRG